MARPSSDVYVTLLTSEGYLPGAMVLAHSLRDGGTRKQLACMAASDLLSGSTINELRTVYDHVIPVDRVHNPSPANLYLMNRPDLSSAFTKINLWRQTQYRKIVYIDADVVALKAPDELFALEEPFSAAPDIGWPDCFNSGVMALTPNMGDYYALKALADRGISFDGADQGLLNMHFRNYNRLSFAYNCTPSGNYQYVPAYRHFQSTISLVHFIGREKPWNLGREHSGGAGILQEMLGRWWAEYDRHYRVPTTAAISGQAPPSARIVQQFVTGDQHLTYGYSSSSSVPSGQNFAPSIGAQQPLTGAQSHSIHNSLPLPSSEEPISDDSVNTGFVREPPNSTVSSVVEQRRFSAPHAEWDPIKQAPPTHAKPEAANFPSETYTMSANRDLWQAPTSYPEPPKNMWYEVPKTREVQSKPRPIFPWEEKQAPPTRVFAEERAPPLPPAPYSSDVNPILQREHRYSPIPSGGDEFSVSPPTHGSPIEEPSDGKISALNPLPAQTEAGTFVPTTVPFSEYKGYNAWDEDDGISRYVSILQRRRKGGTQVLLSQDLSNLVIDSPDERRGSLKITEFPTAVERPSLPVTPAPIRREMFWGSDRDAQSNLPEAKGVPAQVEWNPEQQLEHLRRNSLLFASASPNTSVGLPDRNHPKSSQEIVISPSQEDGRDVQNTHSGDVSPGVAI